MNIKKIISPAIKQKAKQYKKYRKANGIKNNNKYYSLWKLLTYKRMINFVMSHRGGGKTFACKKLAIENFLNKGEQFVYLRRYKTEISKEKISKFFDDIKFRYPDIEFKVQGNELIINDKVAGYALALSQMTQSKSVPYPFVTTVIFDEFVINDNNGVGGLKYLKNEVHTFLDMISTIVRDRNNVRVICCANSISYVNDYFNFWKIDIDPLDTKEFYKSPINKQVILHLFKSEEFQQEALTTKFGQLITGTDYGNYNLKNEALLDTGAFVRKDKPKDATFQFAFKYHNNVYGAWYSEKESQFHINKSYNKNSRNIFAVDLTSQDFEMNTFKRIKTNGKIDLFRYYLHSGYVFYTNESIKKDLYRIYKLIGLF